MFCKNCGKALQEDFHFCPYCNTPCGEEQQSPPQIAQADQLALPQQTDQTDYAKLLNTLIKKTYKGNSLVGKICTIMGIIVWALGGISALIIGIASGEFQSFAIAAVSTFTVGMIFFALGAILGAVKRIENRLAGE